MLVHETKTYPETQSTTPEKKNGAHFDSHAAETLSGILNSDVLSAFENGTCDHITKQVDEWLHRPFGDEQKAIHETLAELLIPDEEYEFRYMNGDRVLAQNDANGVIIIHTAAEHISPRANFHIKVVVSDNSRTSPHEALNGSNNMVGGKAKRTTLEDAVNFRQDLLRELAEITSVGNVHRLQEMNRGEAITETTQALYGFAGLFDTEAATLSEVDQLLYNDAAYCRVKDYLDWLVTIGHDSFEIDETSHIHLSLDQEQHTDQILQAYDFDMCWGSGQPCRHDSARIPLLRIGRDHPADKFFSVEVGDHYKTWRLIQEDDYEGAAAYKNTVRQTFETVAESIASCQPQY